MFIRIKILSFLLLISILGFSQVRTTGVFNVMDYGVKNDSSADGTTAFRAMVASLPWGATVRFPAGVYRFSDSIHLTKDIQIIGDGMSYVDSFYSYYTIRNGATNIYFSSATKNFFVVDTGTNNRPPVVSFQDFSVLNNNYLSTAGNAFIFTNGTKNASVRRVTIRGFFNQIYNYSAINTIVEHCVFWAPAKKVFIQDNKSQTDAGLTWFQYNNIYAGLNTSSPPDTAFMIHGAGAIWITNNNFNSQIPFTSAPQYAVYVASDWSSGASSDIWIQNNVMENYRFYAIYLDNTVSDQKILNLHITDNQIAPYGSLGKNGIYIRRHKYMSVVNNTALNSSTIAYAFIKYDSCDYITTTGNAAPSWSGGIDSFINRCTRIAPYGILDDNGNSFNMGINFPNVASTDWTLTAGGATNNPQALFQPSTGNSTMTVVGKPLGTATQTDLVFENNSSPSSFSYVNMGITNTRAYLFSLSTSSALPLDVGTSTSNNMRFFSGGNLNFGSATDNSTAKAQIQSTGTQLALHYDASHYSQETVSSAGNLTIAPSGGTATITGNLTLGTAGNKLTITEGTDGRVGQTTLVSGTKAITINGLTTNSRAIVTLVTPSGTTLTVTYQAVCTTNTLTIQANVAAGTINTADGSTLNYFVLN